MYMSSLTINAMSHTEFLLWEKVCTTSRIMMATVRNVTSGAGRRKFQAARFLLNRVYIAKQSEDKSKMKGMGNTRVICK
jgi:hypothetical protein